VSTELADLNVDALHDLARIQKVEGGNDMNRDALVDALDGPVPDTLAPWLGRPRREVYEAAKAAGIDGAKDMQKWELLEALSEAGETPGQGGGAKHYYVKTEANQRGEHVVHSEACQYLPNEENRKALGEAAKPETAVDRAAEQFDRVKGCATCC
jgi:hypothetical protein